MKCYLHIGTEKTATTTLQQFFSANKNILFENNIIYTKAAGVTNNQLLSVAAYNPSRRDDCTKRNNIETDEQLLTFQKKIIQNLNKEIESEKKYCSKIIFSSEHFQSRLTEVEEIERLKQILINFGLSEFFVIVYLRRPADIASSLYSTAIKFGNYQLDEPPPPTNYYWKNICHHKSTIIKFETVFGKAAIIPRIFDKNEFFNNNIIDDILNVIGAPNCDRYVIPDKQNKSISLLGIRLLKHLNQLILKSNDNENIQKRNSLVSLVEKLFSDNKYVMPRRLYELYDLKFAESNEWVRAHYFPNKDLLFASDIPEESVLDISDQELKAIANFIANIWSDVLHR